MSRSIKYIRKVNSAIEYRMLEMLEVYDECGRLSAVLQLALVDIWYYMGARIK